MANIHILEVSGNSVRIVFHVGVPNTNNQSNVNWRTAIINSRVGGATILPDGSGSDGTISAAEKADIVSGVIYESVVTLKAREIAGMNLVQIFARYQSQIVGEIQARLSRFGASGG